MSEWAFAYSGRATFSLHMPERASTPLTYGAEFTAKVRVFASKPLSNRLLMDVLSEEVGVAQPSHELVGTDVPESAGADLDDLHGDLAGPTGRREGARGHAGELRCGCDAPQAGACAESGVMRLHGMHWARLATKLPVGGFRQHTNQSLQIEKLASKAPLRPRM